MSRTCSALFCSNRKNPKYQYCYDCAKRKGLIGNNNSGILGWIVVVLIIMWIFG